MSEAEAEPELEAVAGLLEDPTAREILTATSVEPMSANTLKERCDASGPTIYRRLERLREAELVVGRTRVDPEGGHHHTVYEPNVERITVELGEGELTMRVERRETMSDRFTRLVEEI